MKNHSNQKKSRKQEQSTQGVDNDLESRIQKSREAIANYPAWARQGMKFQGGGVRRTDPDEPIE